jgi:hypothetical protein
MSVFTKLCLASPLESNYHSAFLLSLLTLFAVNMGSVACAEVSGEEFIAAHGDFFHLSRIDRSDISLDFRQEDGVEEDGGDASFDLSVYEIALELPLPLSLDSFLILGARYNQRDYDFEFSDARILQGSGAASNGVSEIIPLSESLHTLEFKFGFGHFFTDNVLLRSAVEVGYFSNLEPDFDVGDLTYQGEAELIWRINPGAQVLIGLRNNEDFDDQNLYPILGLRLLSEDGKFHIHVTLPTDVQVAYRVFTQWEIYLRGQISGDSYRVEIEGKEFDIQTHDQILGAGIRGWLFGHLMLGVEGGIALGSELEFKLERFSDFRGADLESNPYLRAQIGIAL